MSDIPHTCATCQHWTPDPHDNHMGACTGLIAATALVEITSDSENQIEIFTHETFSCKLHLDRP